jgi:A/G-specific adenine glycosylase
MPDDAADARLAEVRPALLRWYRGSPRPLAWRITRDPWAILVSEIMLQQTQAARVEPLWLGFLERFPSPRACAEGSVGEVLQRWQGLGYNRRAVRLHDAARTIVDAHGGRVPDDLARLLSLPGVGDYTARAVLAFAFDRDAAPVDTNVARVLSRAVAGAPTSPRELQDLADEAVPPGEAGDWSQALMDLGAGVCRARSPRCAICPLAGVCAWRGDPSVPDPAATGAARVRKQAPFAGSDRQHRGRLVDALRAGPLPSVALTAAAGLPDEARVRALVEGLVRDGLAEWDEDRLRLPV